MPTPPKESIGGRLMANLTQNIKDKKKCFDLMMVTVIFLLAIIELKSLYAWYKSTEIIPEIYWNYYALNEYPFYNTLGFFAVSLFFLLKIFRYNSCTDTKIITTLYFSIQFINVLFVVFKFGAAWYTEIVYPLILTAIVVLILIKAIRWFGQK